jgi:hypothetical protein
MIEVKKLNPEEWSEFSKLAHAIVFEENRPAEMNRISFCYVTEEDSLPLCFVTVRELDNESLYFQYGGAFPSSIGTPKTKESLSKTLEQASSEGFKRVSWLVKNTNVAMQKLSFNVGFIPTGIRNFEGEIYVEYHKKLDQ